MNLTIQARQADHGESTVLVDDTGIVQAIIPEPWPLTGQAAGMAQRFVAAEDLYIALLKSQALLSLARSQLDVTADHIVATRTEIWNQMHRNEAVLKKATP